MAAGAAAVEMICLFITLQLWFVTTRAATGFDAEIMPARLLSGLDLRAAFGHFASTSAQLASPPLAISHESTAAVNCPIRADRSNPPNGLGGQHSITTRSQQIHRRRHQWPQPLRIDQRRTAMT